MRQYTTPTLIINLLKADGTPALDVIFDYLILTLRSEDKKFMKNFTVRYDEIEEAQFEVTLTQEDTAGLPIGGSLKAEINWFIDDRRFATAIKELSVRKNLLDEVVISE